jgi:hypothetical protein
MHYNRNTVSIITPPAVRPITAAEMRAFLNLETTADDALLEAFIDAGADAIRQYCKRSLVTETLELRMDGFRESNDDALLALGAGVHTGHYSTLVSGGETIDLPFGPVASVVSITTFDRANNANLLDVAVYGFDASRVYLNESQTWPSDLRGRDAVAIRYTSGTAVADIPKAIIQSLRVHVAAMYECREGCEMPPACKAMLASYRRMDQMGFEW